MLRPPDEGDDGNPLHLSASDRGVANQPKPPFVFWWSLWGVGGACAVAGVGIDLFHHANDRLIGRDFMNLWVSGRLALSGRSSCIFDPQCFRIAMAARLLVWTRQNFSYPPDMLFVDMPFAVLPYFLALACWTIIGSLFYYQAAKRWLPNGFSPMLAIVTPAALINIWNGHYGFVFGSIWLLFFRYLAARPRLAGFFAGLLTLKPHMGLLVAVAALTKRRAFVAALATTMLLVALSALCFGLNAWLAFFTATVSAQADVLTRPGDEFYFRMMPSGFVAYGKGPLGITAQFAFVCASASLLMKSRRVDPFTFATATFLIVPYVFNYDMTVAVLGFAVLLWSRWGTLRTDERAILSLAFLAPEFTYFAAWLVPPVLLAALWVQTSSRSFKRTAAVGYA